MSGPNAPLTRIFGHAPDAGVRDEPSTPAGCRGGAVWDGAVWDGAAEERPELAVCRGPDGELDPPRVVDGVSVVRDDADLLAGPLVDLAPR